MRRNKLSLFIKKHTYLVTSVVCCLAILILMVIYVTKSNDKSTQQQYLADLNKVSDYKKDESSKEKKEEKAVPANAPVENNTDENNIKNEEKNKETAKESDDNKKDEYIEDVDETDEIINSFSSNKLLKWPVNGNVIMNYSMDKSIYFETLNQYKYNPALIIQAQVNDKVVSAAEGTVVSVDNNEETGITVTVDLGDGYELVYGQLKDVNFVKGTHVHLNETIGYINEPTKYYKLEGSNLYLKLLKDKNPINPLDYLE